LFLVWRRCIGGPNNNVTGEAPDFLATIDTVKDEISIVILAVCLGTHIILEPVEYLEGRFKGLSHRGETP
jgi:hypothetical protein